MNFVMMMLKRICTFIKSLVIYILIGDAVDDQVYVDRLSVCFKCIDYNHGTCKLCGCNVFKKAKWSTTSCNKKLW